MNQLTISKKTFEELIDILESNIFNTKRRLVTKALTAEEQKLLECDLGYTESLYERARDETGHVWDP
jgi:hypothetical protein